jgi:hypothetical protein
MSAIPYAGPVGDREVGKFLQRFAPDDVRETIAWLASNGYTLSSHRGEGSFGAEFVYVGDAEVHITVDRSQWLLDVAPRPGAKAWQYDLLIAAQAGQPYGEVFPQTGSRSVGDPLPDKLPEGVIGARPCPASSSGWMVRASRMPSKVHSTSATE